MKFPTLCAISLALPLLSQGGCTAPVPGFTWNKPGATPSSFAADAFQCKQTARASVPGGGFEYGGLVFIVAAEVIRANNTHNAQQEIYNECLAALGYERQS